MRSGGLHRSTSTGFREQELVGSTAAVGNLNAMISSDDNGDDTRVDLGPVEIHVVSDSTGETAARLGDALKPQFPPEHLRIIRHRRVGIVADVEDIVGQVRGRRAIMLYTLVEPDLRAAMRTLCQRYHINYCDLLRQPIEAIERVSGAQARMQAGGSPVMDAAYFRRVAAMEFAVRYDDGLGAAGLDEADVVLVGVSRSSKTPLSIYLGYLGYRAANVPIVRGRAPPGELWNVDPGKVVGLVVDADRLLEIRSERIRSMGDSRGSYANLSEIYEEIDLAKSVHRRLGCTVLNMTNAAIEEAAQRIIQLVDPTGTGASATR